MSEDKQSGTEGNSKREPLAHSASVPRHAWLAYALLTMLLWGGWGLLSKPVSDQMSAWQVQTVSAIGLLPVIGLLALSRNLRGERKPQRGFWLAFGSGVVASLGNVAYYRSLGAGGKAAAVTPLTALYPLVTIVLAMVILHERLNWVQLAGVFVSLAAMYFFNVSSDSALLTPWLALALIPIGLWGASALLQKCAALEASGELATVGFLLGTLPVSVLTPLWVSMNWSLHVTTWVLAVTVGLLFGLGNLTLIFAYCTGGKASVVTPMAGLYSVVTIPLAVMLLGERVTWREGLGIALALGAAVALSYEKRPASESPALTS
jgi:drug/metabolite transporter (DMT)-like permease